MTPAEASALLTMATAYDNRNVTEETAKAWAAALDERMTFQEARRIVIDHYAQSRDWLMPADLNSKYQDLRQQRIGRFGNPTVPAEIGGSDYSTYFYAYQDAVAGGATPDQANAAGYDAIGQLPPSEPVKLVGPPPEFEEIIKHAKETEPA